MVARARWPSIAAKSIVSIAAVVLILSLADLSETGTALKNASMLTFTVALLTIPVNLLVRSYKWQLLLQVHGGHVPLLTLFRLNCISLFFNNFFLGRFGGDAFRALTTKRFLDSTAVAASSIVMERIIGFFTALTISIVMGVLLMISLENLASYELLATLAASGSVIAVVLFFALSGWSLDLQHRLFYRLPQLNKTIRDFSVSVRQYQNHRVVVLIVVILSVLNYIIQSLTMYLYALAVGAQVSYFEVMFISIVTGLLVMIPISMNGIGVQEGSYAIGLTRVGVEPPTALAIAILARIALLLYSVIGGLLFGLTMTTERQPLERSEAIAEPACRPRSN